MKEAELMRRKSYTNIQQGNSDWASLTEDYWMNMTINDTERCSNYCNNTFEIRHVKNKLNKT